LLLTLFVGLGFGPLLPLPELSAGKPGRRGKATVQRRGAWRRTLPKALPPLRDGGGLATLLPLAKPGSPAQVAQRPLSSPSPRQVAVPAQPRSGGKPAKVVPTDSDILDEARGAYVKGERQRSIDLAMVVAEKSGELAPRAWQFIGLAACSVKAHRLATRAYQKLQPSDQRAVADACRHNGLTYQGDQFVAP
jgi:hypothetical protein